MSVPVFAARSARAVAPLLLSLLGVATGGGCNFNSVAPATGCVSDNQCDVRSACTNGACIPRAARGTWAIELVPSSDSLAAPTQLASVKFTDGPNVLTADAKVTITGDLPVGSALAGDSHVIATVQAVIPGHADFQFETDWSTPVGTGTPPPFSLTVPGSALSQAVTFRLLPLPPRDAAQPPLTIQTRLATMIDLNPVNSSFFVTGRLVTPDLNLSGGFVARALAAGQLISNVAAVNTNGGQFRLEIPTAAASSTQPIAVEIVPAGSQYTTPRFTTPPISVTKDLDLGDLNLPALGFANRFRFQVVGPDQQPVAGALVRARTVIASDSTGASDLLRDGTTDANGNVDLALLPGSASAAQSYAVSVIPPPSSRFGIACANVGISGDGLSPGSSEDPPISASLQLPNKVSLSGAILSADGVAVPGVTIAATRTAVDPTTNCAASIVAPTANGNSNPDGTFQLMVDPGTYRLDFDPPAGASVPRLTETGVVITTGQNATRVVQMLSGALLSGLVQGTDGKPLPLVDVRFLEIACAGPDSCFGPSRVEPLLRAEAHTDASGTFRAVVPLQQSSP